ncbi:MAG: hypothetical protein J6B75_01965 [Ruminococcus sp.]|nr:hypothetical protein [Ruminococcus sp.]
MKKLISLMTAVLMSVTVFAGCTSSNANKESTEEKSSAVSNSDSTDNSNEQGKNSSEILRQAGWTAENRYGLGFYAPMDAIDFEEDRMLHSDYVSYSEFGIGKDSEYGNTIFSIYCSDAYQEEGVVFTADTIEYTLPYILTDDEVEPTLYKEDDNCFIYHQVLEDHRNIYLLCKESGRFYRIQIYEAAWIDTDTGEFFDEPREYKAGDFFTEERYEAFINSLKYLGNKNEL